MIKYDPLWETMKKRHISQYDLYTFYGVERSLLDRFRKNKNVEIFTLDRICTILKCNIEDVVVHVPDEENVSDEPVVPDELGPETAGTPEDDAKKLPDEKVEKEDKK